MPVTVQTALSVDRSVDRTFKNMTVAGQRSTARSTQSNREQSCLQSVDRSVDRYNVHTDTCTARATVDWDGRPAKPVIGPVDCSVDWLRSKIRI